ncbi:SpoIIE family protein phosphatase [Limibacter armeniacum]|uniref:GAF domain-containing SpoIIE family protein phosphatase n=1 Tax=Limibacter armeniacum TaxID=466084 RepID=UPI002FE63939
MKRIFLLLAFTIFSHLLLAQEGTIKLNGLVVNEDGRPLEGVSVSIEGGEKAITNRSGKFVAVSSKDMHTISSVMAEKKDFVMHDWAFLQGKEGIQIMMVPAPLELKGILVDKNGNPKKGKEVKLAGLNFAEVAKSDSVGTFTLKLPHKTNITKESIFLVDGKTVSSNNFIYDKPNNRIKIVYNFDAEPKVVKSEVTAPVQKTEKKKTTPKKVEPVDDTVINPVLVVVVYDEDITPAHEVKVKVDNELYETDAKGEFEIFADSINDSEFEVPDFKIIKKVYDYEDNYMFIHIQGDEPRDEGEVHIEYESNFQSVFNSLESEKQMLQENGQDLRKEINKINEKLDRESQNPGHRKQLEAYLERLQNSLIENELAFQEAQYKTHEMLSRMKNQIVEKDEELVKVEQEKIVAQRELYIMGGVALASALIALLLIRISKKLKRQKDELEELTINLDKAKKDVLKAHDEMLAVTDIGQRFTATLDFEQHMAELQDSVSLMLDATVFGIGIYNEAERSIEFYNQIDEGEIDPYYAEEVDNENSFATWCFRNEVELIINDVEKEYFLYVNKDNFVPSSDQPQSMIYMPLIIEAKTVGVITMQSYEKNAYANINISNLKSLVSYAAISVANHKAYSELKRKNKHITDGLRYAQTIQDAILPSEDLLKQSFDDFFLLYRSKDIVSGDFYWFTEKLREDGKRMRFIAVVDCTGHGVPGAFMSMIGNTLLNEIINIKGISDTVEIMDLLNDGVRSTLRQEEKINDDGMDVCLCVLEEETDEITKVSYTGAKRPLYYYRNRDEKLDVIQGDIKSIGSIHRSTKEFTSHVLHLQKGDLLYLTTDGYIDQNNFDKEKIGSVRLTKMLEKNADKPISYQKKELEAALDNHQGKLEQRDDITIMGIKL